MWIEMKTSRYTGEPKHGAESARRENRAAKETRALAKTDRPRDRETIKQRGTERARQYSVCVCVRHVGSLVSALTVYSVLQCRA